MSDEITMSEVYAIRKLIRIIWPQNYPMTALKADSRPIFINGPILKLSGDEVKQLFPDSDKYELFASAEIYLNSFDIFVRMKGDETGYNLRKNLNLKSYKGSESEVYHKQFRDVLQFFVDILGRSWIVNNLADTMATLYDSMSYTQAKAVIYKELGTVLDTNMRTQLYRLRNKIRKYKPLIDNFSYLLSDTGDIASELDTTTYGK